MKNKYLLSIFMALLLLVCIITSCVPGQTKSESPITANPTVNTTVTVTATTAATTTAQAQPSATTTEPISQGYLVCAVFGGMTIPEDSRYNATYHGKDPWMNPRVRRAMNLAVDRTGIRKSLYGNFSTKEAGVPLFSSSMDYRGYGYDPVGGRGIITEAGYPNGFSLTAISYDMPNLPNSVKLMQMICGEWERLGIKSTILTKDYSTYLQENIKTGKTAGNVFIQFFPLMTDPMSTVNSYFLPSSEQVIYVDKDSYALYQDSPKDTHYDKIILADKLNKYYFDYACLVPLIIIME